jgi:hypothetical protein
MYQCRRRRRRRRRRLSGKLKRGKSKPFSLLLWPRREEEASPLA